MQNIFFFLFLLVFADVKAVDDKGLPPSVEHVAEKKEDKEPVSFKISTDVDKVVPSSKFLVGIEVDLQEGWKAYWKNPGDSGAPLKITWKLPEGFNSVDLEWPAPERHIHDDLISFGYHKPFVLLTEVEAPATLPPSGDLTFEANIQWVICSAEQCLPGETDVKSVLPIGAEAKRDESKLGKFKDALPLPIKDAYLEPNEDGYMIVFPQNVFTEHVDEVHFFPLAKGTVDISREESLAESEGHYYLFFKQGKEPFLPTVEGVITLISRAPEVKKDFLVSIPLKAVENPYNVAPSPFEEEVSLPFSLLMALVGGLLLNVMPCVLPIISLKIMSFVKLAKESRRLTFLHGISFSLGVILSFLFLGGLLFFLRGLGMDIGWGFQLQDPTMVAFLAGLILLMSLLFFGVYDIGTKLVSTVGALDYEVKKKNPSLLGSFSSGVLATALSTPCSGPFLGTALGLSMTLPPHLGILIFLAMGIGMALPYLILSSEPSWLKFIPKPGPWMDTFKEIMGFLLLLTVVWLMWVFLAQANSKEIFEFLFALFLISLGAWVLGKFGSIFRADTVRMASRIVALILFAYAGYLLYVAGKETAVFHPEEKSCTVIEGGWETFSPGRLQELRAEGVPIFIDFTAKWCLLCQSNFHVLEGEAIKSAFEKHGVVKMEADWTRSDPEITKALASFGRNSVPLYVYYPRGKGSLPVILPQLLTQSNVLEVIEK